MTQTEYTAAVAVKLAERMKCSADEAANMTGDCADYHADGLSVDEAVENIMWYAADASR